MGCISSETQIRTTAFSCGTPSLRCCSKRAHLVAHSESAVRSIKTFSLWSRLQRISKHTVLKEDAVFHARGSLVVILAMLNVILRTCMQHISTRKACSRLNQPCGHSCQKPMRGEDCGPCRVLVDNVLLLCGHTLNQIECHKSQKSNTLHCNVQVKKTVPGCRHLIQIECGVNIAHKDFKCPTPCTEKLICGHDCSGSCGKCKPTAAVRLSMPSA